MVVVALVLGILGAVLAIFFQWLAIGLAGFAAGVHGGLAAAAALGFSGSGSGPSSSWRASWSPRSRSGSWTRS